MDKLYKFTTKMTGDYSLQVDAVPQYEAIRTMYATLSRGISDDIVRNMPNSALIKLLSQLLEQLIGRQGFEGKGSGKANDLLLELRSEFDA